ncbi:hypothetical protein V8G54_017842 [Vigna mungo]|uniref:Uncharacterized protein n=1 Tax=Vigna mungo TaxID=3915 RepID=A0AAQ3NRA3_VIGMU
MFSSFSCFTSSMPFPSIVLHGPHHPPAFAYFISGGNKDGDRIFRLLLAVYHPRNRYLLHLGMDARDEERQKLGAAAMSVPAIRAFRNVDVVGKADYVTYMGSSNVAVTLRAASVMMKLDAGWDWFVTLSARDYPLVTQDGNANTWHDDFDHWKVCVDGLLVFRFGLNFLDPKAKRDLAHVFSSVQRDLNFIDHTSDLGWKEKDRFQPIVVDPALYLARRSQIFHATQKRDTPDAFNLFTGKSILSYNV